jgi:hypothetical protein
MRLMETHARVAAAILETAGPPLDAADRAATLDYVVGRIAGAPTHLRLGVDAVAAALTPLTRNGVPLDRWSRSRLLPVRRYVQLVRALTLFAAYERVAPLEPR